MIDNLLGMVGKSKLHLFAPRILLFAVFVIRLVHLDQFDPLFDENLTQAVVHNVLAGDFRNNWKFADVPIEYHTDFYNFSSYFYVDAAFVKLAGILTDGPPAHPIHWHRICSAIAGTFAAFFFYLLARKWFDRSTALVYLAFLAVAPILVQDAHYARPEAVEILLVGLLYLLSNKLHDGTFRYSILAAACACAGFLGAMKFSLLPMVAVALFWVPGDLWKDRKSAFRVAVTAAASLIAGMFAGVPHAFTHPAAYWRGVQLLRVQYGGVHRPYGYFSESYVLGMEINYFWQTLGPILLLLAVVASIVLYRTMPKVIWRSLCLPILFYFGMFGLQRTLFERNLSHVVPLILMLSAAGLTFIVRWVRARAKLLWIPSAVAAFLFIGAVTPPALVSYQLVAAMMTNTEDRASVYEGNLVKKVGLPFEKTGQLLYNPELQLLIDLAEENRRGVLVRVDDFNDSFTEHYLGELGRRVQAQQVGFFPSVFRNLSGCTLQVYHSQSFRYLILRPLAESQPSDNVITEIGGWKFRRLDRLGREINPGHLDMNSWVEDGFYPEVGPPRRGRSFGSWTPQNGDANTGVFRMGPTDVVEGPTLLIPIVTGPNTTQLSIIVKDHDSGAEVARMNPPVLIKWTLWQVDLPKGRKSALDIIASDEGSKLGQWMAIGIPRTYNEFMLGEALPMPDGSVSIRGSWTKDGYYPAVGPPPVSGVVYGSWSGKDANVGTLRLKPTCCQQQAVIGIPVVTGPYNGGLSVKVLNSKTGKVIASLDPPPIRVDWWVWNVDLPREPNLSIEIVAEDRGTAFGQWLAIGQPHTVR
jgi:4-amino-4-deoxy-L-arabinose transferase-like glycosyltransferase